MYNIKLPEMRETYGGNRPQRGIMWGRPPPTRFYRKVIEKAIAGYCQGDRKGYCWLLSR
jgi:hypothetical protein